MLKVRDISKMTDTLRGVLRVAEATCGDFILHNAAFGDKESKDRIMERPEDYISKVAIAGYLHLLTAIIDQRPDLIDYIDPTTGRTPLINAAWGGSFECLEYLVKNGARVDFRDKNGRTSLDFALEFKNLHVEKYLEKKFLSSVFIKHKKTNLFVGPNDESNLQLILHEFNPKTSTFVENQNPYLFRFEDDQLLHVQSGKYAHPIHGRNRSGVRIGLSDGSDGERTSCFPFDFDPTRCLLAGGDNYFVAVNRNHELEWRKYSNTMDENNPFDSRNGFEFEIIQANVSACLCFL